MPRPRSGLNARLPVNLSLHATGQYRYSRLDTRKDEYLGRDRGLAVKRATVLNAHLIRDTDPVLDRILGRDHTIAEACELFERESIPTRAWKPKTEKLYRQRLNRIRVDIGHKPLATLKTRDCAEYLRAVTDFERARQQYRTVLVWVLARAVNEGWIEVNPAEPFTVPTPKRQRARMTMDDYHALHALATPWLRNAMDLALITLLRSGDIVRLRWTDIRDGFLYVVPSKTDTSTHVRLRMALDDELAAVVERCRDGVDSPFVVHRIPQKLRPTGKRAAEREHHTQVLEGQRMRAFKQIIRQSKRWNAKSSPPTFHEIRSLGGHRFRELGWTHEQVRLRMGHASEEMTKAYLRGHDAPLDGRMTGSCCGCDCAHPARNHNHCNDTVTVLIR